ncbi:MAG: hypothetical protein ABI925_09370 [Verrucomicrobiota bacterium]
MRLVILSSIAFLSFAACDSASRAPQFITSTGIFDVFGKQITIKVFETVGQINYTVSHKETNGVGTVGPQKQAIARDRDWFIYPASAGEVWIYDGDKNVLLMEFGRKHTTISDIATVPDLLQRAPSPFLNRLPSSLKTKGA